MNLISEKLKLMEKERRQRTQRKIRHRLRLYNFICKPRKWYTRANNSK